jgi:acyl carrier protein
MSRYAAARRLVADALGGTLNDVPDDGAVGTVAGWDSLGHVRVIMAVEACLGRPVQSIEVATLRTVADVAGLIGEPEGRIAPKTTNS